MKYFSFNSISIEILEKKTYVNSASSPSRILIDCGCSRILVPDLILNGRKPKIGLVLCLANYIFDFVLTDLTLSLAYLEWPLSKLVMT